MEELQIELEQGAMRMGDQERGSRAIWQEELDRLRAKVW
jgi:hypothetical protein